MKPSFKVVSAALIVIGGVALVAPVPGSGGVSGTGGHNAAGLRPQTALTSDLDDSVPPPLQTGMPYYSVTVRPATIDVYTRPSTDAEVELRLPQTTEHGQLQTMLVLGGLRVGYQDWYKVLLPIRPNGSTGWVRGNDVTIEPITYRIEIYLSAHRLDVYKSGELLREIPVGIGTVDTPTPGGTFYLMELLQPPDPDTAYGSFTYVLNGYSNVHEEFSGGPGLLGIHGTNRPELIGQDVSNGCVRMTNENVEWLVPQLPLGTPVQIYS